MLIRFQVHIHSLYQLILHMRSCKCVTTTNMLVFWSSCLSCLPLCQSTSMDGSAHNGNTGPLLNSRVLGVLQVITLFMTQVSVSQSQLKLYSVHPPSWRGLSLQPNLKKGWLDRTSTFRGRLLRMRGVTFFRGSGRVQLSHNKLKSEISIDKKSL